ncbi:MAG: hypothetical protein KKD44_27950 [Proteobacteria bacterium]|nr:hypothetical protein [Pseudomonadota bacterium]
MGDGMSDAYAEQCHWEASVRKSQQAEDEAAKTQEYKDLLAAHTTLVLLIKQQLTKLVEIRQARIEVLKKHGFDSYDYDSSLSDIDASRGRNGISKWALRDLIK